MRGPGRRSLTAFTGDPNLRGFQSYTRDRAEILPNTNPIVRILDFDPALYMFRDLPRATARGLAFAQGYFSFCPFGAPGAECSEPRSLNPGGVCFCESS